ncbi:hypothetical protein [Sediminibacillus sp. JSM 1682029]|uniref:hypothetical protein n=1 Tax=Sediminibacillus sp. JSM 1682029 TaxID=3229857 RepID=UPI003525CFD2
MIETRTLYYNNLLTYEMRDLKSNWQEGIFLMEELILAEGIYKNGPIFFSFCPEKNEEKFGKFTYYLPINEAVKLEDDSTDFSFQETFQIEEALTLRHADQEVDFYAAHQKVKDYAAEKNIGITDTFYCVLLEVYGDIIIDLFVPVEDWSGNV